MLFFMKNAPGRLLHSARKTILSTISNSAHKKDTIKKQKLFLKEPKLFAKLFSSCISSITEKYQNYLLGQGNKLDKFCCTECFCINEIRQFIIDEDEMGNCSYCGSRSVHVCPVETVSSFILEGVNRHYEDAANQVGYSSSEGGYDLPTVDIHEILNEIECIFSELIDDPTDLLEDLAHFDGRAYVTNDPYGPPPGDADEIYYWSRFQDIVKNDRRFTIFLNQAEQSNNLEDPGNLLKHIADLFLPELITVIPEGEKIYRTRIKKKDKEYEHKDLTSPHPRLTINNRMSPAGISFFYGAKDPDTCIHEVRPSVSESVVVGEFEVLKNLFVLDLSAKIGERLGIFDPDYLFNYEERYKPFLRHFISDIAKPIRSSDQDIEYAPTQVFTEFVRSTNFKEKWYFPGEDNEPADVYLQGLMFKSSLKDKGINVVLFNGPDISTENPEKDQSAWLLYKGKEEYGVRKIMVESEPKPTG